MEVQVFIGTSGWLYSWNPDGFKWYIRNSKLNAVELNASFYRFPFPSQVKSWAQKTPPKFRWSIKVNRWITHIFRFSEKALNTWIKFERLFKPLENKIDFYLFQLPPTAIPTRKFTERLEKFIEKVKLGEKFALEWRNEKWIDEKWIKWCEELEITLVSVDSPEMRFYTKTGRNIYLRMHGRTAWYAHNYTDEELAEVADKLLKFNADRIY
ncbi:MAG: DUF72 domain-containing protein, partial [Candidatus Methanomethylicota archaeon]